MSSTRVDNIPNGNEIDPTQRWIDANRQYDKIRIIKEIALTTLKILNIAGILAGMFLLVQCVPVPIIPITELIIAAPFIYGILKGLEDEKITFGPFTPGKNWNSDWKHNLNPATQIARIVTIILMSPYVFVNNLCDLTAYDKPAEASNISKRLTRGSLAKFVENHGDHLDNLKEHGFIDQEQLNRIQDICKNYLSNEKELALLNKEDKVPLKRGQEPVYPNDWQRLCLQQNKELFEEEWQLLQRTILPLRIA